MQDVFPIAYRWKYARDASLRSRPAAASATLDESAYFKSRDSPAQTMGRPLLCLLTCGNTLHLRRARTIACAVRFLRDSPFPCQRVGIARLFLSFAKNPCVPPRVSYSMSI